MPDVSVVIPARDAGRTIDVALSSVFMQTALGDTEVLVVDDGSTDDTAARVKACDGRVRYLAQLCQGRVASVNAGLQAARGEVVMLLRAEDLWMPRKMERQRLYLRHHPQTGLLYGDTLASPSPYAAMLDAADRTRVDFGPTTAWRAGELRDRRAIALSTVSIRREAIAAVGLLDSDLDFDAALADFWTRIAARFAVAHQRVPVAVVRTRPHDDPRPTVIQARNLLHDTVYRRARLTLTRAAHAVDAAIWRPKHPLRVLFEAASPMSLAVFAPVLRRLRTDPRLRFWFTSCDRSWNPAVIFGAAGISEQVITPDAIRWTKFDAYVNTDFWDMTWLPRRTRRVHFFHGVAGKYGLDAPLKIAPVVATFDRLMFPNRDRLRRYAEAGLVDDDSPQAALIGYPKVDCLVDGSLDRAATLARLGLAVSRPTVLYAPTWSPYSSLNSVGHDVIAALGSLGVNVIVKLHDRSYDATARGSGGIDWKQELSGVCDRHGAHLVQDADASPWLHAADVLVTDHSSVGFEFMLLDRPIVVIHSPELLKRARVNPDKAAMLRSAAFVVEHRDAIAATVRTALDRRSAHAAERRSIADELFYCPGSATARAVECIYALLGLPQPASADAPSGAHIPALTSLARSL